MARRRSAEATSRLQRILLIVPYVTRRGGATFDELIGLTGATRKELTEDLGVLFMTGTPPYMSGDMVDVSIDGDHVEISVADQLSRPLTLSRAEATALFVAGTALRSTLPGGSAVVTALEKITATLGRSGTSGLADVVASSDDEIPAHLPALRDAAERRRVVEVGYFAASTGERSRRRIEPHGVFTTDGRWYVRAWDLGVDDERLLRIDRVLSVEETGDAFEPRAIPATGGELYTSGPDDVEVRLLVAPRAAWVAEFYRSSRVQPRADGWLEIAFPASHLAGVERVLLRLGGDAKVVAPVSLATGARASAGRLLARYRAS